MISIETRFCDKMFSMETFGEWILKQLRDRNLTQAELARQAGINRGTLSNIINGHKQAGKDVLVALASALRMPVDTVIRASEGKPASIDDWAEKMNHKIGQLTGARREMAERLLDTLLDEQERETRQIKLSRT